MFSLTKAYSLDKKEQRQSGKQGTLEREKGVQTQLAQACMVKKQQNRRPLQVPNTSEYSPKGSAQVKTLTPGSRDFQDGKRCLGKVAPKLWKGVQTQLAQAHRVKKTITNDFRKSRTP